MMKSIALAAASALIASVFVASSASAQIAPGNYRLETQGSQRLGVQQSVSLNCEADLLLTVNAGGATGNITGGDLSAGDSLCNNVNLINFNWPVTLTSTTFQVNGVGAQTLLGTCSNGQLNGNYSGGVLSITSSSGWTSTPSFLTCAVGGQLTLVPIP